MQQRRLAAIMFTDIVGYTAMMGSDEDRAFEVLRKNREIHSKLIEAFKGTLIKEMGDGMLISFNLASDAVRCAIEIQNVCIKQDIPLKIGIHEGEMVFDGNDVLGDGVNIASRIQDNTEAGCITISASVYRDIKNKGEIKTEFIGEKAYKNVDEPIRVYKVFSEERTGRESPQETLENEDDHRKPIIIRLLNKIYPVIITAIVIAIIFMLYGGTSIPFKERDWIVVTEFENLTEETIFDHSLNTAFILSINQSRYLNVVTRQRMRETLKRMKKEDIVSIDEETGREIAIREGVKICIVPSISRIGTQYILTAKIQEAETAEILRSEVLYAKNQDEIIRKLDQLSKKIRRNLGESRYKIAGQSKSLSKVTTFSLDALKHFSLGIESHINLEFEKAITHYEHAIRLDSNFTAAKASLGNLLFEKFDQEKGRKWLDQAILSIDNLTDKEKYGILAFYAVNVEKDVDKGIKYTKTRIGLYPDDPIPHNNLGWYFQNQGHYERAVEEYKVVLKINPYMMLTYGGLIRVYLENLGQIDSALSWSNRMLKYGPDNPWGYFNQGSAYVCMDSLEKAESAYLKARDLDPDLLINQWRLAHVYRLRGMHGKAIEVLEEILRTNPEESFAKYDIGINYNLMGDSINAKHQFLQLKEVCEHWLEEYPEHIDTYIGFGLVLTRLGEREAGWEMGKQALALDSTIHIRIAELLAVQDRKSEALDHLVKALEDDYRNLVWLKLNPNLQVLQREVRYNDLINEFFEF